MANFYDQYFQQQLASQISVIGAAEATASLYLDGKPRFRGKYKITSAERDADFWLSALWEDVSAEAWTSDLMVLALARYFGQERVANIELLARIASAAPSAILHAVRYSGLVLRQHSPRRTDLDRISKIHPELTELCLVLDIFELAHRDRLAELEHRRSATQTLKPFDLLMHASLYVFEHVLPSSFDSATRSHEVASADQIAWDAINDIMSWKVSMSSDEDLHLNEESIGRSLAAHLSVFPSLNSARSVSSQDPAAAFSALLEAQTELNEFVSRSADAFSYDDSIRFVRIGQILEIEEVDPIMRAEWWRNGRKLARLHEYWFYRALDEFSRSDMATATIGRPENHDRNQLAYIRAMRTKLQLTEVYGVADTVTTDAGDRVDLFQALLTLELMSAFFSRDFIEVYMQHLRTTGDWATALHKLILDGLKDLENRFPLTWSDRDTKISRITGWTVSAEFPQGNPRMAAHILDFWTSDWISLASKLRSPQPGLLPEFLERPILKFGKCLVQLPWLLALQNNSTAAINNLRRLGARRGEAREETQRIEARLGLEFKARGFRVVLNWNPSKASDIDAGEVDLLCARDGAVLVLEVKSTFLRKSQRDAWLHATTTLRKAGRQLKRKVTAVSAELRSDGGLRDALGLDAHWNPSPIHGWIVDTSIERDHESFSGFLKVSLEEILIALRDDHDLLGDPDGFFRPADSIAANSRSKPSSLYPDDFRFDSFFQAITTQAVWKIL